MTVFDTICKWSQEERQQHSDLIKECLRREQQIAINNYFQQKMLKRIHDNAVGQVVELFARRWYSA